MSVLPVISHAQVRELTGVSRLLPPRVAQSEVQELLLEADHRPPVLPLPNTKGGELGKSCLDNLKRGS